MSDEIDVIHELIGQAINSMMVVKDGLDDDYILFLLENGQQWKMYHEQDCCENVYIEDIIGDTNDLIGKPLLMAEVYSHKDELANPDMDESGTYTFYKFATINGYVTIRWYGSSNGYYSEAVSFHKL